MTELIQQLINGLVVGGAYAVVALGFGLTFSVMRIINMAHPEFFMLGAYMAFLIPRLLGIDVTGSPPMAVAGALALVVVATLVLMSLLGLAMERLVVRPTWGTYHLVPMIATAGVATAMQYGAQRVFGLNPLAVPAFIPLQVLGVGGLIVNAKQIAVLVCAVALMVGLSYYVYRTKWGRATRAVAEHYEVAAGCGINVDRVAQLTMCISAGMGGVSGISIGLLYGSASPFMGAVFGLKAFVCTLVAGNRRIEGIMVVGLMLGVVEGLITGYISSNLRDAVAFGVLLAILCVRPSGIFGSYK